MNNYDKWGWYTSEDNGREADSPPPVVSETVTPGDERANWTGREWVVVPYTPQVICEKVVEVPKSITSRQGRIVLARAGLLVAVSEYFLALPVYDERRIEWESAAQWDRDWNTLAIAAKALGLSEKQVDQMFIDGAVL